MLFIEVLGKYIHFAKEGGGGGGGEAKLGYLK